MIILALPGTCHPHYPHTILLQAVLSSCILHVHMDGGDTGIQEARKRAWVAVSHWLSVASVVEAAPSYRGDPEDTVAGTGWLRGAVGAEVPLKNGAARPLGIPADCVPGVMAPLLSDHRLGHWLQKGGCASVVVLNPAGLAERGEGLAQRGTVCMGLQRHL